MNTKLIDALDTCIQILEQGGTVAECLDRFPTFANDLRPLLEQSVEARSLGRSTIPASAVTAGRVRVLNHAAGLRQNKQPIMRLYRTWRLAAIPVLVLFLFFITGNGLLAASARSLPGDALYPLKRSVEGISLFLAPTSQIKSEIQKIISTRRITETESLLSKKRVEAVEFGGQVSKQLADGWTIAGIHVQVTEETQLEAALAPGAQVHVRGQTQLDGSVLAAEVNAEIGKKENIDNPSGSSGGEGTQEPEITNDNAPGNNGGDEAGTPEPAGTGDHPYESKGDGQHDHPSPEESPSEHHYHDNDD